MSSVFPPINYKFTKEDFERAFNFAVTFYLAKKNHTGRTTGEPRGLGSILDAYTMGKLVEIGVKKMFEFASKEKEIVLDFSMRKKSEVAEEPDIVKVIENDKKREPAFFIEIKHTSQNDRWIGLTEEQFSTMKKGAGGKRIYIIYTSINSEPTSSNHNSVDLVGMYLKKISNNKIFSEFAPLNCTANLEFIVSENKLEEFGTRFPKDELMYETNLFRETFSVRKKDGDFRKGISPIRSFDNFANKLKLPRKDGSFDSKYGIFYVKGSFNLYEKQNKDTKTHFIECTKNTFIQNDIFGEFLLESDKTYTFTLETLGQFPTLKRNNLLISKRRIYQLIDIGKIQHPGKLFSTISDKI